MRPQFAAPRSSLALLLLVFLAGGCNIEVGDNGVSLDVARGRATDEWSRTYSLATGGSLEIVNLNGRIEATAAEGRELVVDVSREARARSEEDAQALLMSVEMREEVSANRVRIEARVDVTGSGRRGLMAKYRLRIPAGLTVSLQTENGSIRVENVSGRITATATNGPIDGRNIAGSMSAEVVNGGVEIEMASVTDDISLSSINGPINLQLPTGTKASIDATCVNGAINVDDALSMQTTENSRRKVTGTLNGGGPRIVTSTVNGGIRIRARETRPSS
jgi:hypothetical protein